METNSNLTDIRPRLAALRAEDRHLRLRDAARRLGASEGELISSFRGGPTIRLRREWAAMLEAMPSLGEVMALTRNEHAVIEKVGRFEKIEVQGHAGLVLGTAIDLRLFLDHWRAGFAVKDDAEVGLRRSLQFFDASGTAVHKIFINEDSDAAEFERFVHRFADADQTAADEFRDYPAPAAERADAEIDVDGLRAAWAEMKDTHDFVFLLRRFGVSRTQALRLAGPQWTAPVPVASLRTILDTAASSGLPIMVFIGNRGAIEIHTGPVKTVKPTGAWMNVLDADFNLHVHEPGLAAAWLVRKPTVDGIVTAVEFYDAADEVVGLLFGKRKPGELELPEWRTLAESLA